MKFAFFIAASAVVLATSVCAQQAERNIPPNTGTTGSVVTNGDTPLQCRHASSLPPVHPCASRRKTQAPRGSSASGPARSGQK